MNICVYGCGYFGITIACGLSEIGHKVHCIDKNDYRITNLKKGIADLYEPDIKETVLKNINNNLFFYDKYNIEQEIDIFIIAVGAAENQQGGLNIESIIQVINEIISKSNFPTILIKSTLSIGDCDRLINEFKSKAQIVYNPEFFAQGSALNDFLSSEKIILANANKDAVDKIKQLYKPITNNIIEVDTKSAELAKLATDSFLALKISFINEIANLSSKIGADISSVKKILIQDKRVGADNLQEGIGYGGNAITKSINIILNQAKNSKCDLNTIKASKITNESQKRQFVSTILKQYSYNIEGKVFCVWGLSFKENTSDIRESSSNTVIDTLVRYGATIRAYDPKATNNIIKQYKAKEDAVMGSNALIILTPWEEFKNADFDFISKNLTDKMIFDARNLYLDKNLAEYGLKYYYIGKNDV